MRTDSACITPQHAHCRFPAFRILSSKPKKYDGRAVHFAVAELLVRYSQRADLPKANEAG